MTSVVVAPAGIIQGHTTMRAARLHEYGRPLVLDEVPVPRPLHDQVLIRVEGAGFCHSDLHVIEGEIPILPRMPLILGHENAGTVVEIGEGVTAVANGDAVAVMGGWGCGSCPKCLVGEEQLCLTPGWAGLSQYDGGYAEYLLVPHERYLVPLQNLEPRMAAPLTDAALTPYRAIKRALPFIEPDYKVLVVGIGGLGQFGIKLLRILSGAEIIAVDVSSEKLRLAREYGATFTLNSNVGELGEQVKALSPGGVCAAFDFVGNDETLALALNATRTGGKVTQIGLAGGTARMKVMEANAWEVVFEATLWGTVKELREVVALAESGRLTPIQLEFAPLDHINEVHDRLKRGEINGRVVITP